MNAAAAAAATPDPITAAPPNLRRRNSISTSGVVPTKLSLPTTQTTTKDGAVPPPPPPQLDFELISLKDLIPFSPSGGVNSPTAASATNSGYEITIRNRLVKQAAWAYLQPMSSSPSSYDSHFLRRLWLKLAAQKPFASCLDFINLHLIPTITRAFDRILRALRVRTEK